MSKEGVLGWGYGVRMGREGEGYGVRGGYRVRMGREGEDYGVRRGLQSEDGEGGRGLWGEEGVTE